MSENEDVPKYFEALAINIGGNTRFYLNKVFYYLKISKKKPLKDDYLTGPNKEENYLGYTNHHFRNAITTIIVLFLVFSVFGKLLKIIF